MSEVPDPSPDVRAGRRRSLWIALVGDAIFLTGIPVVLLL
jgi:hypothetical protein